jgi:hypothetical protein
LTEIPAEAEAVSPDFDVFNLIETGTSVVNLVSRRRRRRKEKKKKDFRMSQLFLARWFT